MAITASQFGQFLMKALNKEVKWAPSGGDTFKVSLYTGTIPANAQDTWVYKSDIATIVEVANGNGYTTGGQALSGQTITYTVGTNTVSLDANDVTWSASTISADLALIYQDTGTASTSVLVGYVLFGQTFASSNGDFKITWNSNGILSLSTT